MIQLWGSRFKTTILEKHYNLIKEIDKVKTNLDISDEKAKLKIEAMTLNFRLKFTSLNQISLSPDARELNWNYVFPKTTPLKKLTDFAPPTTQHQILIPKCILAR